MIQVEVAEPAPPAGVTGSGVRVSRRCCWLSLLETVRFWRGGVLEEV